MNEENSKLLNENIELKRKLDEIVANLEGQIAELKNKNAELVEQIEAMKAEKSQQKMAESNEVKILPIEKSLDSEKVKLSRDEVPIWLIESFAWIKRPEMADSHLSTSSRIFHELCWPKLHGNVKPHFVEELGFGCGIGRFKDPHAVLHRYKKQNEKGKPSRIIPIAAVGPPEYILGFTRINLYFLDSQVIRFMEIASKSRGNPFSLRLRFTLETERWHGKKLALMYNLLATMSGKIFELKLHQGEWLFLRDAFRCFPEILNEIQLLKWEGSSIPDFIFDWLNKQRSDGKLKILCVNFDRDSNADVLPTFIERLKQEFTKSTKQPMPSFLVHIYGENQAVEEFTMENEQFADQVLTLYHKNKNWPILNIFIEQYRKGEEDWIKEWKEKICDSRTKINLQMQDFGALLFNNSGFFWDYYKEEIKPSLGKIQKTFWPHCNREDGDEDF